MLEMPESYLVWRSTPAGHNRTDWLVRAVSNKNNLNEAQMLEIVKAEHDLLIDAIPPREEENLNTYYWKRFHRGVTVLMYGDIHVVESLFVDRRYLLKGCSIGNPPMRFERFLNLAFLKTLLDLLMLMNSRKETYSVESDYILIDWFRKNKHELVWDNELRKFLIAQFEEKLNSRDNLSNM